MDWGAHQGHWRKHIGPRVFVLHPGITPLGNDSRMVQNNTGFYSEMCPSGVNTQWMYSGGPWNREPTQMSAMHAGARSPRAPGW